MAAAPTRPNFERRVSTVPGAPNLLVDEPLPIGSIALDLALPSHMPTGRHDSTDEQRPDQQAAEHRPQRHLVQITSPCGSIASVGVAAAVTQIGRCFHGRRPASQGSIPAPAARLERVHTMTAVLPISDDTLLAVARVYDRSPAAHAAMLEAVVDEEMERFVHDGRPTVRPADFDRIQALKEAKHGIPWEHNHCIGQLVFTGIRDRTVTCTRLWRKQSLRPPYKRWPELRTLPYQLDDIGVYWTGAADREYPEATAAAMTACVEAVMGEPAAQGCWADLRLWDPAPALGRWLRPVR